MRILVHRCVGLRRHCPFCRKLLARGHTVAPGKAARPAGGVRLNCIRFLVPDIAGEFDRRTLVTAWARRPPAAILHRSNLIEGEMRASIAMPRCGSRKRLPDSSPLYFLSSVEGDGEDSGSGSTLRTTRSIPQDSYGRSKLEAERALTETTARNGIELVIIRPPLVYGPRSRPTFFVCSAGSILTAPAPRERAQPPQLIYVGNLVGRDRALAEHPRTRTFLVSDEESV